MMKQRSGRIVNTSSVMGIVGNVGQANYSASKAGIIGLTKSSAKELGRRGITVNAIAPGYIVSKMTESLPENEKKGVIVVEGHMVERLHFDMAQRVVEIADQIRAMEEALG